jgi:hypothetical protein
MYDHSRVVWQKAKACVVAPVSAPSIYVMLLFAPMAQIISPAVFRRNYCLLCSSFSLESFFSTNLVPFLYGFDPVMY